jgi:hypothetical protein
LLRKKGGGGLRSQIPVFSENQVEIGVGLIVIRHCRELLYVLIAIVRRHFLDGVVELCRRGTSSVLMKIFKVELTRAGTIGALKSYQDNTDDS